tara:strand:- start:210 stop:332 length:123 start_codon:yes stop_codon:yes gene_type:complete
MALEVTVVKEGGRQVLLVKEDCSGRRQAGLLQFMTEDNSS